MALNQFTGKQLGQALVVLGIILVGGVLWTAPLRPAGALKTHWAAPFAFDKVQEALDRVGQKVERFKLLDQENQKLLAENSKLRVQFQSLQFKCDSKQAEKLTQTYELQLSKETGTKVGRFLASIPYQVPHHLSPLQLYTLGMLYFNQHQDEKAAVIFTTLTGLQDDSTYKTPRDELITGIAWYRLDNLVVAENYFDQVLKSFRGDEALPYQAQARLWKAIIAKKLNKDTKAQFWLKELLDQHPHAVETTWVNQKQTLHE